MITLTATEWMMISDIILTINATNAEEMRISFLEKLEDVVPFDSSVFYTGYNTEHQKDFINPIVYKHPYQKVRNPNDICNEYRRIKNSFYGNWVYWLPNSTVFRDSDLLPESIRVNTEIYQKIFSPTGMHYGCGVSLIYDNILLGVVGLYREKGHSDFTEKDMYILNYIKPHLTYRMYQLHPQGRSQVNAKGNMSKEYRLTQREIEIIPLICKGFTNKEIGTMLFVSEETVKKHVQHIFCKMNVKSRLQLIRKWTDEHFKLSILDDGGSSRETENPNYNTTPSE